MGHRERVVCSSAPAIVNDKIEICRAVRPVTSNDSEPPSRLARLLHRQ